LTFSTLSAFILLLQRLFSPCGGLEEFTWSRGFTAVGGLRVLRICDQSKYPSDEGEDGKMRKQAVTEHVGFTYVHLFKDPDFYYPGEKLLGFVHWLLVKGSTPSRL